MKSVFVSIFVLVVGSHWTVSCVGAIPGKSALKSASVASVDDEDDGDIFGDLLPVDSPSGANSDNSVPSDPPVAEAEQPRLGRPERRPVVSAQPSLRWIAMGDFGESALMSFGECTESMNIQRSPCSTLNDRCVSSFATSCAAPEGCRRLFKCISGQTNTLVWFPIGDGTTQAAAQGASPSYGLCSINTDIAGRECSSVNSRCLSSFCTSGSGSGCGRRVFKSLTTGVAGRYFYRWMGDTFIAGWAILLSLDGRQIGS